MMMCHLTTKTNCGGWIANRTKLQGAKSSFRTLGCKIQSTPNFRCNVPVKVKKKKKEKKKRKEGLDLMGTHAPPTHLFPTTHHTHKYLFSHQLATYPPSFVFFFFFFFSQTHTPLFTPLHSHVTRSTPSHPPWFFRQGSPENSLGTSKAPSSLLI